MKKNDYGEQDGEEELDGAEEQRGPLSDDFLSFDCNNPSISTDGFMVFTAFAAGPCNMRALSLCLSPYKTKGLEGVATQSLTWRAGAQLPVRCAAMTSSSTQRTPCGAVESPLQ